MRLFWFHFLFCLAIWCFINSLIDSHLGKCMRRHSFIINSRFYNETNCTNLLVCLLVTCSTTSRWCTNNTAAAGSRFIPERIKNVTFMACCVCKCFCILILFPAFDEISTLQVLSSSFLVKCNQFFNRLCHLDAMFSAGCAGEWWWRHSPPTEIDDWYLQNWQMNPNN